MLELTKTIFKHIPRQRYHFCQQNNSNKRKQFLSLKSLKQNIQRQHSYVRKNNEEIGQQLIFNIQNNKWGFIKKMLLIINLNELQTWFLMRKIAKEVNHSCNGLKVSSMSKEQISDLLSVLVLLRFQPKQLKSDSFKGKPSQFDDSTLFIGEIQNHVNEVSIQKDQSHYFQLLRKLLHTNPFLFLSRREELQKKIINNLQRIMQNKSLLNDLLVRGCISNFWTKKFKTELLNKNIPENYLKALRFEDILMPTKIEKAPQEYKIKTQSQIMNILQGFGYEVEDNVLVNRYEVDFMMNKKLIVEYNGHHHYIINSKKLVLTAKDRWKSSILRKRGFTISSISFNQWKVLKLFEQKRKFLVTKIENDWLKAYKYIQQEQK